MNHRTAPTPQLTLSALLRGLAGAAVLLTSLHAQAATLVLQPVQDASLFTGTPTSDTLAEGSGDFLWLSTTAEGLARRTLLRFDLSPVPAGSVLREARLVLYESRSRADHPVTVHRLLASWQEGPANAGGSGTGVPAQPADVTWLLRGGALGAWAVPGGDFVANPSATTLVGPPNQTYAWTGPGLLADVQLWLAQPQANHGWLLRGDELTSISAKRFESRENTATANRPRLELQFDPPAQGSSDGDVPLPAWALAGLALALAGALRRRASP